MNHLLDMIGQVKKLKNGVGVQTLLDEAYKILGNPIIMFDTGYKLQAHTEAITDDPFWNEIITHGMFSDETLRLFGDEGFIEDVANSSIITIMKSEKIKYDRIGGKIFNKNNTFVSLLLIIACNKPFEEDDEKVFEIICKLISKEVSKSKFYQEYEQAYLEIVIKNLIDGNYDKKRDTAQVSILYDSLKTNLYIMVAFTQNNSSQTDELLRNLLKQRKHTYKYAIYSKYIIIIISTNDETINVSKELSELINIFEKNNIYAGMSSRFENLFELQKHYKQAHKSMQYALRAKSSQRIFPYNESSIDKMEQIEKLSNGLGVQYFLNKGAEIFGNPLLFHDMELNLLGYTENVEIIDPIWQELIAYGTGSDETINLFKTEGFVDIMDNTKGGAILISEKIKYDRISWRIYNSDNIRIGCTSIVNTDKQFSEDELVLFGVFSQKFSKEVGKIEFYNNYGQVYSETIINRLISGKIDDYTFYSEDVGNLYDNLMESLYLVVVDISQCKSKQINLTFFRDLFNHQGAINRYAIYDNHIIIIISIDNASVNINNELNKISKVFEQNNIYAGVSRCFENIYKSQEYYLETLNALNNGIKKQNGKRWVFRYEKD